MRTIFTLILALVVIGSSGVIMRDSSAAEPADAPAKPVEPSVKPKAAAPTKDKAAAKKPEQDAAKSGTSKPSKSKTAKEAKDKPAVDYSALPEVIKQNMNLTIGAEILSLEVALVGYKSEYGDFPPDGSDERMLIRHIRKRWPRIAEEEMERIVGLKLSPATSLPFWLRGFSPDPSHPYTGEDPGPGRYEFDPKRLVGDPPIYVQAKGPKQPYLYFEASSYDKASYEQKRPYRGEDGKFLAADKFQIIAPGLDGDFGSTEEDVRSPNGQNITDADRDNITNLRDQGPRAKPRR